MGDTGFDSKAKNTAKDGAKQEATALAVPSAVPMHRLPAELVPFYSNCARDTKVNRLRPSAPV